MSDLILKRVRDAGELRSDPAWNLVAPTLAALHSDRTIDRGAALRKPEQR